MASLSGGFPPSYFDSAGMPVEGAARSEDANEAATLAVAKALSIDGAKAEKAVETCIAALQTAGMVVTLRKEPYPGQVGRVRIDAFGESASEVEATLLEYAGRCDAATQASEVTYGECVIERNLEEQYGAPYSWRGRMILHPTIGTIESSQRATEALAAV